MSQIPTTVENIKYNNVIKKHFRTSKLSIALYCAITFFEPFFDRPVALPSILTLCKLQELQKRVLQVHPFPFCIHNFLAAMQVNILWVQRHTGAQKI
jgi:hypothetical protein